MALRISITDLDAGTTETKHIDDGEYLLVLADPCVVVDSHQMTDGRHQLIIAGATRPLGGPVLL